MEKTIDEATVEEIRKETNEISAFINKWIEDNPYENNLEQHNAKFKVDFKAFFDKANFIHEKYDIWNDTH